MGWCLFVMLIFLGSGSLQAQSSAGFNYSVSNSTATITGYSGTNKVISIPSNLNGYTVTRIGTNAFYESVVTSVTLPDSVTVVGAYAFARCFNLTNISLGNGLSSIGDFAFWASYNFTSIVVPNSVSSIGGGAFYSTGITNITLPQRFWANISVLQVPFLCNVLGITAGNLAYEFSTAKTNGFTNGVNAVLINPNQYNLYSSSQLSINVEAGKQSILTNPNAYQLYTSNQIHNLRFGGLMLNKQNDQLKLNYEIQQSADLQSWDSYEQHELVLSNVSSNKLFLRLMPKE
jgi:hypothetical protein